MLISPPRAHLFTYSPSILQRLKKLLKNKKKKKNKNFAAGETAQRTGEYPSDARVLGSIPSIGLEW